MSTLFLTGVGFWEAKKPRAHGCAGNSYNMNKMYQSIHAR